MPEMPAQWPTSWEDLCSNAAYTSNFKALFLRHYDDFQAARYRQVLARPLRSVVAAGGLSVRLADALHALVLWRETLTLGDVYLMRFPGKERPMQVRKMGWKSAYEFLWMLTRLEQHEAARLAQRVEDLAQWSSQAGPAVPVYLWGAA